MIIYTETWGTVIVDYMNGNIEIRGVQLNLDSLHRFRYKGKMYVVMEDGIYELQYNRIK